MKQYEGVAAAANDVRRFYIRNEDDLPAIVRERVGPSTETGASPVDLIVHFTEAAFANRADLTPAALEIAAGCADVIDRDNYHGRLDNRVVGIKAALRRDSGEEAVEGTPWPDSDDDPAPNPTYAVQPDLPAPADPA